MLVAMIRMMMSMRQVENINIMNMTLFAILNYHFNIGYRETFVSPFFQLILFLLIAPSSDNCIPDLISNASSMDNCIFELLLDVSSSDDCISEFKFRLHPFIDSLMDCI